MRVSKTAGTARGNDHALTVMGKVGDLENRLLRIGIELAHDGAHGHAQDEILPCLTVFASALAVSATLRTKMVLVAIVDERRELGVGLNDDVTATASVAAVWPALGHMGLASERHAAGAAVAAFDVDATYIGKLGHRASLSKNGRPLVIQWASRICMRMKGLLRSGSRMNAHAMLHTALVLNGTVNEREEGIVLAAAHILTGVDVRATLADENRARSDGLATEALAAKTLTAGIAAITGGTESFFVCHVLPTLSKPRATRRREPRPQPRHPWWSYGQRAR